MKTIAAFAMLATAGILATVAAQDPKNEAAPQGGKAQHAHDMKMSGDMPKDIRMMNKMMMHHLGKKDHDFEKRFIDMMIPHHEGAILMAKQALHEANRPELKEMAEKAIKDQQKEIEQLKAWRHHWYDGK